LLAPAVSACRPEVNRTFAIFAAFIMGPVGQSGVDVPETGTYGCVCCGDARLFVEGDWFPACACHGTTVWDRDEKH